MTIKKLLLIVLLVSCSATAHPDDYKFTSSVNMNQHNINNANIVNATTVNADTTNAEILNATNTNIKTGTYGTLNTEILTVTGTGTINNANITAATATIMTVTSLTANKIIKSTTGTLSDSGITENVANYTLSKLFYQTGLGGSTYFGDGAGSLDDKTDNNNSGFGYMALNLSTSGYNNSAFGLLSLYSLSTGHDNSAMGYKSLSSCNGNYNSAFGVNAGILITTGNNNTAVGYDSLAHLTTNSGSTALGTNALHADTGGSNIGIGYSAGNTITSGTGNLVIGYNSTTGITTGKYNTIIGGQISGLSSSLSNNIIIADGQGNKRIIGDANGVINIPGGLRIGTDSTNNMIDDASNGTGSTTLYIGNKAITTSFTLFHDYQVVEGERLQPGELCSLVEVDGTLKIVRTTKEKDKTAIGIYQGVTSWKDSLGNQLIVSATGTEINEVTEEIQYDDLVALDEYGLIPEPFAITDSTDPLQITYTVEKEILTDVPKPIVGDNATQAFAYSVACAGDSIEENLRGAWVIVDGTDCIEPGDLLCSSTTPGYLEKQPPTWKIKSIVDGKPVYEKVQQVQPYTVGVARTAIHETTTQAYIYIGR